MAEGAFCHCRNDIPQKGAEYIEQKVHFIGMVVLLASLPLLHGRT